MKYVLFCAILALTACGDDGELLTREQLLDPATCESCHPKAFAEWQSSMHAYAADDPVFLAMNARGQRETGGELGDFCVNCHAPMAVREGLTTDGLNLDEVPQHLKGVTCYFCHSVDAVEGTHDNPLRLADDGVLRGGVRADVVPLVDNGAHEMAYSPLHDSDAAASSQLCGACHDIVTPAGVHLERTYLEWQESVFPSEPFSLSCGGCHMNGSKDIIADFEGVPLRRRHAHGFPGIDVALTDWPGKAEQRALIEEELESTVQIELCYNPEDGGVVQLSLTNIGAGHMWPSGSAQDRRAWVELYVESGGEVVIDTGSIAEGEAVASVDDPLLWQLRDYTYDAAGEVAHMFWDVASFESELLPPAKEVGMAHNVTREYMLGGQAPSRMTAKVHVRPIGLDVLDDLIESGDLDPALRDTMPTFTLSGSQTEWTPELAGSDLCVTSRVP